MRRQKNKIMVKRLMRRLVKRKTRKQKNKVKRRLVKRKMRRQKMVVKWKMKIKLKVIRTGRDMSNGWIHSLQ